MAIYDTLPVYKVSYDFLLDMFKFTKNFDLILERELNNQ